MIQRIQPQITIYGVKKAVRFVAVKSGWASSISWVAFWWIQDIVKYISFAATWTIIFPHPVPISVFQDPFVAFHLDKTLVRKYMSPLLIGELAPDQPSFEPSKNVSIFKTWYLGWNSAISYWQPEFPVHKMTGSPGTTVLVWSFPLTSCHYL